MRDPTDLMAFLSLLLGWYFWQKDAKSTIPVSKKGLMVLPLAALLTLANSPAPNKGVDCLQIEDDKIIASVSVYGTYASEDGGLNWKLINLSNDWDCDGNFSREGVVVDPENSNNQYRTNQDNQFEYSTDKGKTWRLVPGVNLSSEAERVFYIRTLDSVWIIRGP